jgi:hypothetical protein
MTDEAGRIRVAGAKRHLEDGDFSGKVSEL